MALVFSLGKNFRLQTRRYNYNDFETVSTIPKKTWKRGKFGQNAWGVADMVGNVWEWTLSCYTVSESRLRARPDIGSLNNPDTCSTRVLGGENCAYLPDFLRDSYRGIETCGRLH